MRVVATIVARDEADIIDSQIAYHLGAGIDFVIVTDHESRDGTTEILERYEAGGRLRRIPESGPVLESDWRTHMARLAATEHGADWVINMDADQFWWPRWGTLKDTFAAVPDEFGIVGAVIRQFVPRPEDGRPFFERMTTRVSPRAPINDPTSPWRPGSTVAHRADPNVVVLHAGYSIVGTSLRPLPGWFPFEILHFPFRTAEQWLRKTSRRAFGDKSLAIYVKGFAAGEAGRADEVYGSVGVDDVTVARGVEDGVLAEDTRLRNALRSVRNGGAVPTELQPGRPGPRARRPAATRSTSPPTPRPSTTRRSCGSSAASRTSRRGRGLWRPFDEDRADARRRRRAGRARRTGRVPPERRGRRGRRGVRAVGRDRPRPPRAARGRSAEARAHGREGRQRRARPARRGSARRRLGHRGGARASSGGLERRA